MAYYVIDENNNKIEALDKQGVLSVLEQAIRDGTLANIVSDGAFVSKLKCCVGGTTNHVAFITQAKYNELKESGLLIPNCYYFIIDDTTADNLDEQLRIANEALALHTEKIATLESRFNGDSAKKANQAVHAEGATNAQNATRAINTDISQAVYKSGVITPHKNTTTLKFASDDIDCPDFSVPQLIYIEDEEGNQVSIGMVNVPQVDSLRTKKQARATGVRRKEWYEDVLYRECLEFFEVIIEVEKDSNSIARRTYTITLNTFNLYQDTYYDNTHPYRIYEWKNHGNEGEPKYNLYFKPIR